MRGIVATTDLPRIISGCLDMLPHERHWDNDAFEEWLEMFVGACRVWYRLPTPRPKAPSDEPSAVQQAYNPLGEGSLILDSRSE